MAVPFSIVVVTWNSASDLPRLLESIERYLDDSYEVVFVDNASSDESAEIAAEWHEPKQILALQANLGFGAANNRGVAEARHDTVVLLNPDTYLVDGSIPALAELADRTGALCGPELLNEDGTRQPSASPVPGGWEVGVDALLPATVLPRPIRFRCEPWRATETREVGWLTGACVAGRRGLLRDLGPFDETMHLFGEDMELGLRARQKGISSLFAPEVARVVHVGGRSARQRFRDEGLATKIRARRAVVRSVLGPRRERYDFGAQFVFHATRYVSKTALRRPHDYEKSWLTAARTSEAPRDGPAPEGASPPRGEEGASR